MHHNSPSTHSFGSQAPPETQTPVDYTGLSEGVPVQGHLLNGLPTKSTARCPSCNRVGVLSVEHEGSRWIVHTGLTRGNTLEGVDYCEITTEKFEKQEQTRTVSQPKGK